jgi:MoaA/NifB/PqqE/SkfB family radical SAM enzyme
VTVSLDSGIAAEHDEFRGMKRAFERTVRGIQIAREEGLKVIVACTISAENAGSEGVARLIEQCRRWGVLFFIVKAAPSGNWAGNTSVLLREEDSRWIDQLVAAHPHCRTDFEANFLHYGCGAMKEIIYIDQYGNVMPCPFIQVSYGNVLAEPLARIRDRGLARPEYAAYSPRCLIAEDKDFLSRYLAKVDAGRSMPIPCEEFGEPITYPAPTNR